MNVATRWDRVSRILAQAIEELDDTMTSAPLDRAAELDAVRNHVLTARRKLRACVRTARDE